VVAGGHRPPRGFNKLGIIAFPPVASARRHVNIRQKNAALKSIEDLRDLRG
jgi:hypothetical protein